MLKNEKAFTLIEMLIVLLIISMLILLIVPNLTNKSKNVHEKGCQALVDIVRIENNLMKGDKQMEKMRQFLNSMEIGSQIEVLGIVFTKVGKYKFKSQDFEYSTIELVQNYSDFDYTILN